MKKNEYNNIKNIILVPDFQVPGGVTNYYKTLELNKLPNVCYFQMNRGTSKTKFSSITTLLKKYLILSFKLFSTQYHTVVINPSLDLGKSFHRDSIFILLARFFNKKTIVFFHGWFDPYEIKVKSSRFKSFLFKISYAKVDRYIVLGSVFKSKLLRLGVPANTTFFIETMVADSSWLGDFDLNKKYETFDDQLQILFLSRIEKEKGIFIAIDAFERFLQKSQKKATLIIAGNGPDLQEVKEYVNKNKLANIKFLGHVSGLEKKKVLFESHIMILPSFTEGLPNVILEGMLYGMPIISRSVGGIPEVIIQGSNGYLSESYNPTIFGDFLMSIANDKHGYKVMAERNHEIAVERFTSDKVRERILNILETV